MKHLMKRKPDFENLLRILRRQVPSRPTLFEFFLNEPLYQMLGSDASEAKKPGCARIKAFQRAGYDYTTVHSPFGFPRGEIHSKQTISLNEGFLITDRKSFEAYAWPKVDEQDYSFLDKLEADLPDGMKLIMCCPGGVLENTIALMGYDNLCMLLVDDPGLIQAVCDRIGSILVRHTERSVAYTSVGAFISNDDWGFKTQPMMSPADMRRYIVPWHQRIVAAAHAAGKPAILHSCGNLESLMGDIIDVIGFDGKHSYEDIICPVEQAYDRWAGKVAVLGGIDVDYLCRQTPKAIRQRCENMLQRASAKGGYALGSGNSIPQFVPNESYFAMIETVTGERTI
jgi:uroporphyrinogen decarboxylase